MLTRDSLIYILDKLDDRDLGRYCQTNRQAKIICESDIFWRDRIVKKYGSNALSVKLSDSPTKYRDFYQSGKVKTFAMCLAIPHGSQLVVEDLYHPENGWIDSSFTRDSKGIKLILLKIAYDKLKATNDHLSSKLKVTNKDLTPLEKAISEIEIPEYRRNSFSRGNSFTDKDETYFINLINLDLNPPDILRSKARTNPDLIKSISPDPIKTIRFIRYIHQGFKTKQLPLTILWQDLCSHRYILNYQN